jgi:recombinational DNA repair ATPase RecF
MFSPMAAATGTIRPIRNGTMLSCSAISKKTCAVRRHRSGRTGTTWFFSVGPADLRKYGSQGQQRTAVLALKLSELEYVKSETG